MGYTQNLLFSGEQRCKDYENFTIILIGCMTLALNVLAMFTLSMGSQTLKCALLIYGWLPAHTTIVMGVAIFLINIRTITEKYLALLRTYTCTSLTAMGHY